jgi:hypothetical protein
MSKTYTFIYILEVEMNYAIRVSPRFQSRPDALCIELIIVARRLLASLFYVRYFQQPLRFGRYWFVLHHTSKSVTTYLSLPLSLLCFTARESKMQDCANRR